MASPHTLKNVTRHWDDEKASRLSGVEELVYRSNCLGRDQRITNTGGGNTSAKITETDPVTGEKVEVLWVKGSGGDLRTSKRENFSSLYQDKLLGLQKTYAAQADKGLKTPAEDDMVGMYAHCTFNLNPRPSSIDTPLHSFIPHPHVDHTHPNAAIAVAACARSKEATREIYGDEVVHLPWMRPGFELGLAMQKACADHPQAIGFIMGQHGLINWGRDRTRMLRTLAATHRPRRRRHRGAHCRQRRRRGNFRRTAPQPAAGRDTRQSLVPPAPLVARTSQPIATFRRHRAG